jgi:hypothetical protein
MKRLSARELFSGLLTTAVQILGRQGFRFAVELSPTVLLRAWPPAADDQEPLAIAPPGSRLPCSGNIPSPAPRTDAPSSTRALARSVRDATFRRARGYAIADVDRLLDSLASTLEAGEVPRLPDVTGNELRWANRGYDVDDVDTFLRWIQARLTDAD